MLNIKRTLCCVTLAGASLTSVAFAQPPTGAESVPTAEVSYAGVDLSSGAGIGQLNGRIRLAAERLCKDTGVRDLARAELRRRCVGIALSSAQEQVAQAIAQFRSPQLAARTSIALRAR